MRVRALLFALAALSEEPRWTSLHPSPSFSSQKHVLKMEKSPGWRVYLGVGVGGSAEEGWLLAKANRCLAGADVGVHLQHISKHKYLPVASPKHPHPLFSLF